MSDLCKSVRAKCQSFAIGDFSIFSIARDSKRLEGKSAFKEYDGKIVEPLSRHSSAGSTGSKRKQAKEICTSRHTPLNKHILNSKKAAEFIFRSRIILFLNVVLSCFSVGFFFPGVAAVRLPPTKMAKLSEVFRASKNTILPNLMRAGKSTIAGRNTMLSTCNSNLLLKKVVEAQPPKKVTKGQHQHILHTVADFLALGAPSFVIARQMMKSDESGSDEHETYENGTSSSQILGSSATSESVGSVATLNTCGTTDKEVLVCADNDTFQSSADGNHVKMGSISAFTSDHVRNFFVRPSDD